jgi:hypothetical protein
MSRSAERRPQTSRTNSRRRRTARLLTSAGGKLWRLRYEFERKEKLLSIGPYPSVGLAEAREVATNAKRLLREGKDPAVEKRLRRLQIVTDGGTTFEVVAREWHGMKQRALGRTACL